MKVDILTDLHFFSDSEVITVQAWYTSLTFVGENAFCVIGVQTSIVQSFDRVRIQCHVVMIIIWNADSHSNLVISMSTSCVTTV